MLTKPTALLLAVMLLSSSCAAPLKTPCEFPLWVRVTADADGECRALGGRQFRNDKGNFIKDTDTVLGCAPRDRIITNGTEANMGHELKHHVERNCAGSN